MFDDQSNQAQQGDTDTTTPSLGLGINPNPSFVAPTTSDPTPPPVAPTTEEVSNDSPALSAPVSSGNPQELENIKTQALNELSPLVGKLDQNPEEKYKTLMMLIQASDNQDLIAEAYEAAQSITDEKVKAEALLNIVNEINYFTQHKN